MTLTNGDAATCSSELMPEQKVLDHTEALDVLRNEHKEADGLDAKVLLDSRVNGGLTYNDFLVLPGYIGNFKKVRYHRVLLTPPFRLCCFRCCSRHSSHEAGIPEVTTRIISHGHSHRTLDGNPHGPARGPGSRSPQLLSRGSSRDG